MKKNLCRTATILSTVVLLFLMLSFLSFLTVRKDSYVDSEPFYKHSDQFDILFFGSSHIHSALLPMELWTDFGYVSYNLGSSGATIPMAAWTMANALDYSEPDLIILDCYRISYPDANHGNSYVHVSMDNVPFSLNKIRASFDLGASTKDALELLFPFSIFHSRWDSISQDDLSPQTSSTNGATININVAVPNNLVYTEDSMAFTEDMPGVIYLEKVIELCNRRNIQLLLTYLPFPATLDLTMEANAVADFAKQHGVDYINFLTLDVVDMDTDMYDASSHLNYSGSQNVSSYIGQYISEHYNIPDRRGDPNYAWMETALSDYYGYMRNHLYNEVYLANYLLLLRQNNKASVIYIEDGSPIYDSEIMLKLIENIPLSGDLLRLRAASENDTGYLLYINNATGELQEYMGQEIPDILSTGMGQISVDTAPVIKCQVYDGFTGETLDCDRSFHYDPSEGFVRDY